MRDHEQARAWLSAFRDAEGPDDPPSRTHLDTCPDCQRWTAALGNLDQALARSYPPGAPDVTAPALSAWNRRRARAATGGRARVGRGILVLAGLGGVLVAALSLTSPPETLAANHLGRDLLGFQVAFSIGFLLCSRDPIRYVRALLPLTAAASLAVGLQGAADLATTNVSLLTEASHLPVLAGLLGLFVLLGTLPPAPRRARRRAPALAS